MSEIFETVNANSAAAGVADERTRHERKLFEAERQVRRRKKATKQLVLRALMAIVAGLVLFAASHFELIDPGFGAVLGAVLLMWVSVWYGAWLQFMFSDGGLLNGSK